MTLAQQLSTAQPGDVIALSGPQGDVYLSGKAFSPAVTIRGGQFASLTVKASSGLHFDGIEVDWVPGPTTVDWSAAVTLDTCSDVALTNSALSGGNAVSGVPEDATALDSTGCVIGRPCGYGVNLVRSHSVTIAGNDIGGFDRQINMNAISGVTISKNTLHDRRRTAIAGGNVNDLLIEGNVITSANPWRWGQTPVGDHADCVALFSPGAQTAPNNNVRIVGNVMEQRSGATILGMWFQGTTAAPFTNFEISGNSLLIPNAQGIAVWNSTDGRIVNNVLVQAMVAGIDPKQRPTVMVLGGCARVAVSGNRISSPVYDKSGGLCQIGVNPLLGGAVSTP